MTRPFPLSHQKRVKSDFAAFQLFSDMVRQAPTPRQTKRKISGKQHQNIHVVVGIAANVIVQNNEKKQNQRAGKTGFKTLAQILGVGFAIDVVIVAEKAVYHTPKGRNNKETPKERAVLYEGVEQLIVEHALGMLAKSEKQNPAHGTQKPIAAQIEQFESASPQGTHGARGVGNVAAMVLGLIHKKGIIMVKGPYAVVAASIGFGFFIGTRAR